LIEILDGGSRRIAESLMSLASIPGPPIQKRPFYLLRHKQKHLSRTDIAFIDALKPVRARNDIRPASLPA